MFRSGFNMTVREAKQRMQCNNMHLSMQDGEYRVTFPEMSAGRAEQAAYYTDDLEDAVLTASDMRRRQLAQS
jgi:methylphosphotriester-DNA--protein-cysteine methyltransferase